jgi:hypothetical protein
MAPPCLKNRVSRSTFVEALERKNVISGLFTFLVCRNTAVAWTELSTGGGYRLRSDLFHRKAIQLI